MIPQTETETPKETNAGGNKAVPEVSPDPAGGDESGDEVDAAAMQFTATA